MKLVCVNILLLANNYYEQTTKFSAIANYQFQKKNKKRIQVTSVPYFGTIIISGLTYGV